MRRWAWLCLAGWMGLQGPAAANEGPDGGVQQKPAKLEVFSLTRLPGVTVGDWKLEVTVTGGTDGSQDTPRESELARQRENDKRDAQRLGEKTPNPVVDMIQKKQRGPAPQNTQDPGYRVAATAHRELQKTPPSTIIDPLSGQPVTVTTGPAGPAPDPRRKAATRRGARHKVLKRLVPPPTLAP